jgi:hypothetical protein
MALTREEILAMVDIDIKKLVVPEHLAKWSGKELYIRQLTRGDQDTYLKRMNGENKIVNGVREIYPTNYYGHDAWLCSRGAFSPLKMCQPSMKKAASLWAGWPTKSSHSAGWLKMRLWPRKQAKIS